MIIRLNGNYHSLSLDCTLTKKNWLCRFKFAGFVKL
ncbi:unnamed protein product [Brassica oleracea var. botrytis]